MAKINSLTYLRRTLLLCCFPVLTVIGANVVLLSLPQAREALEAFDNVKGEATLLGDRTYRMFMVALAYWSVAAWYCSRLLLGKHYPFDAVGVCVRPRFASLVRIWLPRTLGILSAIPLTLYFALQGWRSGLWIAPALFALLFLGFVVYRRKIMQMAKKHAMPVPPAFAQTSTTSRQALIAIGVMFVISATVLISILYGQENAARRIGAPALLLFAFGSWTLFGSIVLVYWPKSYGHSSLALAPLALFLVFCLWNENHLVAQQGAQRTLASRPKLIDDFIAWQSARGIHRDEPIYLVAAAGGASRAAYWTGRVLSQLELEARRRNTRFSQNLYAMSGVSGGSLGIAAFAGSLLDPEPDYAQVSKRLLNFLKQDYLSPLVGYMLYPDLLAQLSPVPCHVCDRSRALEQSWQREWDLQMPARATQGWFARGLPDLNRLDTTHRLPNLILNATTASDGRRVVQSNLDFLPRQAYDIYDPQLDTARLSLAGAVHNSARFPYASPAGLVFKYGGGKQEIEPWDHIVDGGYFENSGAASLNAMIDELVASERVHVTRDQFRVIIIENDPARSDQWICRSSQDQGKSSHARTSSPDVSAVAPAIVRAKRLYAAELSLPPLALYRTRGARAQAAEDDSIRRLGDCNRVVEIRFPYVQRWKQPPMSWFLDQTSTGVMDDLLRSMSLPGGGVRSAELDAFRRNWNLILASIGTPPRIVAPAGVQ